MKRRDNNLGFSKKAKRRFYVLVLCVVFCLSLMSGCGPTKYEAHSPTTAHKVEETSDEPVYNLQTVEETTKEQNKVEVMDIDVVNSAGYKNKDEKIDVYRTDLEEEEGFFVQTIDKVKDGNYKIKDHAIDKEYEYLVATDIDDLFVKFMGKPNEKYHVVIDYKNKKATYEVKK